ncbi:Na+/H+ antiporter subunit A [Ornithinicoccus hortensis]|uniref:Multisubunit sodium/proton antiporter MrpA subunit /multisubunit sodium/proton antiporter MrpB subunit n=1 Tax=Ornithinicoccus hortensis TaxID=82346 RepID=A0A542YMQ8_9MICO|nr:Na+/H+ antiporter subunit A [Ornithinicoccus hortensis]TQL49382.1 multisubunit sodium/proton antiporter MrpA subunit /multisubunit sodium/proton antiporter MrpB subunit [Ornithinicoccus hortensis]
MIALIVAHAVAAFLAPTAVRLWGSKAFLALATVPTATAVWAGLQASRVAGTDPPAETLEWVPSLHIELAFRMDSLSWLMTMIVSSVGALILIYCAHYFHDKSSGLGGFAGYMTAFAGVMLGLVTTDDLLMLYVFWELTSVLSYLLIGFNSHSATSRGAAKQALIVTTFGGLAMLVGIVLLGETQDTYRISELIEDPGSGPVITAGVVLLLIGAVSKSALLPFHFWLPGAMAAPTPVSAYLHAAAMVKAGVYLVARFAPGYADVPAWQGIVLALGGGTMLLGSYRALRQHDLKLLLAYGTVSQLGFITIMVGSGTREAALAGLTLLMAHALFKSSLFLVVGTIDHATGTRDIRRLSGLARKAPVLAVTATLASMSMAGLPPLEGFVGKEAAFGALLNGETTLDRVTLAVVVAGSMLTFAYSARFVWGTFGNEVKAGTEPATWHRPEVLLVAVPALLGLAGLVFGPLAGPVVEPFLAPYAEYWPEGEHPVHLGLWHGVNAAFLLTLLTWLVGVLLFLGRKPVAKFQAALPRPLDAGALYQLLMRGIDRLALEVTGAFARGSLPSLLGTILVMLALLPGIQLLRGVTWPTEVRLWDNPAQPAVAGLILLASLAATRARRRYRAIFLLGVTGYGTAMMFLLHGAPDLALTQVLVETVSLVVFVLVLRRLSGKFPDDPSVLTRRLRALLGLGVGVVVAGVALTASAVRIHPPSGEGLVESAPDYGGGSNIVNVILVDTRAWDTMGELSVVLAAATGVASLVFLRGEAVARVRKQIRASWRSRTEGPLPYATARTGEEAPAPQHRRWLATDAEAVAPERRSTIFEVVTRLVFHTIVIWSAYLLFSGHNNPGGGFAAGLVCGLALALRYLAGRGYELRVAAPVMPGLLLGSGLFIAAASAMTPMLFGEAALTSWVFDVPIPFIGDVHLVTSVFFDVGVYLVVVGLMLDILRSLGSALDDQIAADEESREEETV